MELYTIAIFGKNRPEYLQNFEKVYLNLSFFLFFLLMSCTSRTKSEGKAQCNPLDLYSILSSALSCWIQSAET